MVWIKINLPANPRINGFLFAFYFLSEELTNRLYQALECSSSYDNLRWCLSPVCSDENRTKFDAIREEILSGIAGGTIDSETASKLNVLRRLAESIVIK